MTLVLLLEGLSEVVEEIKDEFEPVPEKAAVQEKDEWEEVLSDDTGDEGQEDILKKLDELKKVARGGKG